MAEVTPRGNQKKAPGHFRYVITYKPYGVVCSRRDRHGRPTLDSLGIPSGLHPAGRLDRDSEGFLLLTNDGHFLHRITHPHFHHPKTYLVMVLGHPDKGALQQLRDGVEIKFGMTRPADVEVLTGPPLALPEISKPLPSPQKVTWLRIVLYEGKKRQIRRMTAVVGHSTERLVRVAIGPLTMPQDLEPGKWRDMSAVERKMLLDWVWIGKSRTSSPSRARRSKPHNKKRRRH